ncbi:MAG: type I glyceraldehyde-3-phosphate dehydrogenase [Candidatus Wallbacteria bacterium]|nr:type I glyceraldehyde-3-phosphate dehydrogenase [Candidatus Wallbacteria bacterium]
MSIRVAINGFGRIGRLFFRSALTNKDIEFVAVNDLASPDTMAHLLKYDSIHRAIAEDVSIKDGYLIVAGRKVKMLAEKDPSKLPWKDLKVDVVVESTGRFTERDMLAMHIQAGAKKVILTAPAKGKEGCDITIVMGVNEGSYDAAKHQILSNASCTTNCLAPVAKVLMDTFGINRGLMTTIHSYTNDQVILDFPHKDLRRARAAAMSMIPTTTGAAKAVGLVLPELKGKLDGFAMRVPTPNVSVVDLTVDLEKEATKEQINEAMKKAADGPMKGILEYCDKPLVSSDFCGNAYSSIFDALSTMVIDGKMAKVISWYDNEWGYSCRVRDLILFMGKKGL